MRRTAAVDRTLTLLVGVTVLVGAATVWAWRERILVTEPALDLSWLRRQLITAWWPWTVGAVGVVLVLLGLVLIFVHLPRRGVSVLRLTDSDGLGTIVDPKVLVSTVADRICEIDGVRTARGRVRRERRQLVMSFVVSVDPTASLRQTASELDTAAAMGAQLAQRDDLAFRVDLKVARRERRRH